MGPQKARKKAIKNRPSGRSNTDDASQSQQVTIASQLFEETIDCAVDDDCTIDAATFATFVVDMLPPDVLETLKQVAGFEPDSVGDESAATATTDTRTGQIGPSSSFPGTVHDWSFLSDIWHERFHVEVDATSSADARGTSDYECELCERVIQTTRHHLYPRETHSWLQTRDLAHYTDVRLGSTMYVTNLYLVPPSFLSLLSLDIIYMTTESLIAEIVPLSLPLCVFSILTLQLLLL